MRIFATALLALFLSGCACKPAANIGKAYQPRVDGNYCENVSKETCMSIYAGKIVRAVGDKIYDHSQYAGKRCTIRIHMEPDGTLTDVRAEGGDPALCQAAIAALRSTGKLPAPPSREIYEIFKNAPLDFAP